jgi:hypothetical protein
MWYPAVQATNLRIRLADVYEREGLWTESAKILSDIPFDSGHKCVMPPR